MTRTLNRFWDVESFSDYVRISMGGRDATTKDSTPSLTPAVLEAFRGHSSEQGYCVTRSPPVLASSGAPNRPLNQPRLGGQEDVKRGARCSFAKLIT